MTIKHTHESIPQVAAQHHTHAEELFTPEYTKLLREALVWCLANGVQFAVGCAEPQFIYRNGASSIEPPHHLRHILHALWHEYHPNTEGWRSIAHDPPPEGLIVEIDALNGPTLCIHAQLAVGNSIQWWCVGTNKRMGSDGAIAYPVRWRPVRLEVHHDHLN